MSVTVAPFRYTDTDAPEGYACGECGARGVQLFREYSTFLHHQSLECRACALVSQGKSEDDQAIKHTRTAIGWRVAAVPTEEGDTYWGYTSIPQAGVDWWKSLPESATPSTEARAALHGEQADGEGEGE
jgi:hypothetical protein